MSISYGVKMFIDEDTAPFPAGSNMEDFLGIIDRDLQTIDRNLHVESIIGYGCFKRVGNNLLETDYTNRDDAKLKVNLTKLPKRIVACDPCDRSERLDFYKTNPGDKPYNQRLSYMELKQAILKDVYEQRLKLKLRNDVPITEEDLSPLTPILICTSDKDFISVIKKVKFYGHRVIVMSRRDSDPTLGAAGHLHLYYPF